MQARCVPVPLFHLGSVIGTNSSKQISPTPNEWMKSFPITVILRWLISLRKAMWIAVSHRRQILFEPMSWAPIPCSMRQDGTGSKGSFRFRQTKYTGPYRQRDDSPNKARSIRVRPIRRVRRQPICSFSRRTKRMGRMLS
jgi:hypothetical protein